MRFRPGDVPQCPSSRGLTCSGRAAPAAAGCPSGRSDRRRGSSRPPVRVEQREILFRERCHEALPMSGVRFGIPDGPGATQSTDIVVRSAHDRGLLDAGQWSRRSPGSTFVTVTTVKTTRKRAVHGSPQHREDRRRPLYRVWRLRHPVRRRRDRDHRRQGQGHEGGAVRRRRLLPRRLPRRSPHRGEA